MLLIVAGCGSDSTGVKRSGPAAHVTIVSGDAGSAVAGMQLAAPLVVAVTDVNGTPVANAPVAFTVSSGNGSVTPAAAVTGIDGRAQTLLTVGTVAGPNQVTASTAGVATAVRFTETGIPGPAVGLTLFTRLIRVKTTVDTARMNVLVTDQFGNGTTPGPTFTVRDPTLVSIDGSGLLHVLRRGGSTYVVATSGTRTDSSLVITLAAGQSLCTGVATPESLAVGQVFTDMSSGYACVHSSGTAGEEYALVPYFNNVTVPSATIQVEISGDGLGAPPSAAIASTSHQLRPRLAPTLVRNDAFDAALRQRERALESLAGAARRWYSTSRGGLGADVSGTTSNAPALLDGVAATANVGDLVTLNASLVSCSSASPRVGRVAAITNKAIIVADTANPAGGFTDAEYQSLGVTFDTLVYDMDVSNFGAPTDIDSNGHIILFFTRAVNELTPANSGSVVLGFFYARDLYPKTGSAACPTSNQAEMFYLVVPDPTGIAGHILNKAYVSTNTIATTAHEFQHLINAARRLYINHAPAVTEETWLNEGLSHIAEELLFYRVSGLQPRHNLDSAAIANPSVIAAFNNYELNNARRYQTYLQSTAMHAPVGADPSDATLETRGAIWSFLRYAADRQGSSDGAFWYNLVNSQTSGVANLANVLGVSPASWMRDWAISVFTDDWVPGIASNYTQPSWNTRGYFNADNLAFWLQNSDLRTLSDGVLSIALLRGGGVTFFRFTPQSGQDALLSVTSNTQPIPSSLQLAIVRVR